MMYFIKGREKIKHMCALKYCISYLVKVSKIIGTKAN